MKKAFKIVLLAAVVGLICSCQDNGQQKLSSDLVTNPKSADKPSDVKPVMQFEKTEFDFGKILQGEVVSYTFHFTNTGKAPLIITSIEKSCGCTTGDFPRQPIDPGKGGEIKVTYDSKGHFGFQSKTVVVNANTVPSQTTLRVKAEVKTPDQL